MVNAVSVHSALGWTVDQSAPTCHAFRDLHNPQSRLGRKRSTGQSRPVLPTPEDRDSHFVHYKIEDDSGIRHAVAQSELLPVIMAKMLWKERLRDRPVLLFTDSEVVREALISGSSRNYATNDLPYTNAQMDADLQARF